MAVAIIGLAGGIVGTAVGTGLGLVAAGTMGAYIAGGIGSMVATSVATGKNPFDDPAGAIASIAMGAMFSQAAQGIFAGQGVTIDGIQAPEAVSGAAGAGTLTGVSYDTSITDIVGNGLDIASNIGYDNVSQAFSDLATSNDSSVFDILGMGEQATDRALIQGINKSLTVNLDSENFFNLDLQNSSGPSLISRDTVGGIFSGTNSATDNELSQTFFSPTTSETGDMSFDINKTKLQEYQNDYTFGKINKDDPFNVMENNKVKSKLPDLGGGMQAATPGFKLPSMPQSIQTLMGSATAGSGTAGQGSFDGKQNPVVTPMIEAYKRQQQRAAQIAQQTWGIQSTSRFSGLLS